jgi:hypothetical protein
MTTPEEVLMRRRHRQILDDETVDGHPTPPLPHEETGIRDFIARLGAIIRSMGKK